MSKSPEIPAGELVLITELLQELKLTTILTHLEQESLQALRDKITPLLFLQRLLQREVDARTERRIERRIRESRLPERKTLHDFDFGFQPSLDRRQVMSLATLDFLTQGHSLILAGHSGTGKSHLAKALMLEACRKNIRCRYTTACDMLTELKSGLVDDTLEEKLKVYTNPDLLCIDELGFDRLEQDQTRPASLFFKVIDKRYGKKSTILTTNMDFRSLGTYLGDPVLTAAMVDRLVHHAIILNIEGPSWRMHQSKALNKSSQPEEQNNSDS